MPNDNNDNVTRCGRCGRVYNPYLADRFWSGSWTVTADDGTTATYNTLCNGCHFDVVRRT